MTIHEAIRQRVAEFYDQQLADNYDTEYAMLNHGQRARFNQLVDHEAGRLFDLYNHAYEAWAQDADEFDPYKHA